MIWKIISFLIIFFTLPCQAQNAISISPNTGTSTLDNLKPTKGDSIELEFPSGFRCKIQSGDTPSLVLYGDQGNLIGITGSRVGIAFVLPLYEKKDKLCNNSMRFQDALSMLEIADKLLKDGSMSNDEYKIVVDKIKKDIFENKN